MKSIPVLIYFTFFLFSCRTNTDSDVSKNELAQIYILILNNLTDISFLELNSVKLSSVEVDSMPISEIKDIPSRLFLYISQDCCQECVQNELKRLIKIKESIPIDKVLILINYDQPRFQFAMSRMYGLNNEFYKINETNPSVMRNLLSFPLYFTLSKDLIMRDPLYVFPELRSSKVDDYLIRALKLTNN